MTWLRLDPSDLTTVEMQGLDIAAFGLLLWLSVASADVHGHSGLPADAETLRRSVRGRMSDEEFARAWPQVRAMLREDENGRLHVPWVEMAQAEVSTHLTADAKRKREAREKARREALEGQRPRTASGVQRNPSTNERTNVRTDTRTDEVCAERAASPPTSPPKARKAKPPKPPNPKHPELLSWWCETFRVQSGAIYAVEGAKDGKAANALLERAAGDLVEIQTRGTRYFADPFHRKTGFSLTRFLNAWNTLTKPVAPATDGTPQGSLRSLLAERDREHAKTVDVNGRRTG